MYSILDVFFKLIRFGLVTEECVDFLELSDSEWNQVFDLAERHVLEGVLLDGISKLPTEKRPKGERLKKLVVRCLVAEKINTKLNEKVIKVANFFKRHGFHPILLKGQGVATWYPNPMRRMPGDIDMWLADDKKQIIKFVRGLRPEAEVLYHHIHLIENDGLEVEVHMIPSFLYNPFANMRLEKLWKVWGRQPMEVELVSAQAKVAIPSDEMNRVYMLLHMYRHLFTEGIGLRQVVDYFLLLKKCCTESERQETVALLKRLNLIGFCGAVMWIMKEVFHLEQKYMIVPMDERRGRLLMNEILMAGNFGQYDERLDRTLKKDSFRSFVVRNKWNMRLLGAFSNEVCWGPFFKIYNWIWRRVI